MDQAGVGPPVLLGSWCCSQPAWQYDCGLSWCHYPQWKSAVHGTVLSCAVLSQGIAGGNGEYTFVVGETASDGQHVQRAILQQPCQEVCGNGLGNEHSSSVIAACNC